ncbi:MAG TPA: hypothetical protein VII69_05870 [Candidatus Eremiobacteraceae bacterium]
MYNGKIAVAAAAIGLAALIGQTAPAAAVPVTSNMVYVSRYVERAADALQNDKSDYGGHRAAAITDINNARTDIANAIAYDSNHGNYANRVAVNSADEATFERSQVNSDKNLTRVQNYLERAINMLSRDGNVYGGYRLKAISDLQAARNQLGTALTSVNPNQSSDSNVRYSRAYIEHGIDMLQHDTTNYAGHRAAAVSAMQRADNDLLLALRADRADESVPSIQDLPQPSGWQRGQKQSNQNIVYARTYVDHAISMLKQDNHDYGGYRAQAVAQLNEARVQLQEAAQSR